MKKTNVLYLAVFLLLGMMVSATCSPSLDVQNGKGDDDPNGNKDIVIKLFERNGIHLQLLDITERYTEVSSPQILLFLNNDNQQTVPVSHVRLESLPSAIRKMAEEWGSSCRTDVYRMKGKGKTYYKIDCMLSSSLVDLYDETGERCTFQQESYEEFAKKASDISCILILDVKVVKNAEGAPNYLTGFWQNDWQHLIHDDGEQATVALYPDLPFSITEVLNFRDDGTGYLRTVKAYKDGRDETTLDPFRYEITDYHGGKEYGYDGFYYKCYFEAGNVIEYLARSFDGMRTLVRGNCFVNYPWFRKSEDAFASAANAGMKYGMPARDADSPIVGRWTAGTYTWTFRSDNTGYRLLDGELNETFAYTVAYEGSKATVTLYIYNTGFTADGCFAKDITHLVFDPTLVPKGKTMAAVIEGNSMQLEGWGIYQRVDR